MLEKPVLSCPVLSCPIHFSQHKGRRPAYQMGKEGKILLVLRLCIFPKDILTIRYSADSCNAMCLPLDAVH